MELVPIKIDDGRLWSGTRGWVGQPLASLRFPLAPNLAGLGFYHKHSDCAVLHDEPMVAYPEVAFHVALPLRILWFSLCDCGQALARGPEDRWATREGQAAPLATRAGPLGTRWGSGKGARGWRPH
jgi:hypothetical protein